jgi:hypothetical protein
MALILLPGDAQCIACGCTDSQACEGGCSWLWVNRETCEGLCSSCPVEDMPEELEDVE